MTEPKHWNELTEQEKKDYKKSQWNFIILQWLMILIASIAALYIGFNLEEVKEYSNRLQRDVCPLYP